MEKNIKLMKFTESEISEDEYIRNIERLTLMAQKDDPTIVLHSKEEIRERSKDSIIALFDDEMIGNQSIYKTHMKPLDNIVFDGKEIRIGEGGSLVVKKEFRGRGIGEEFIKLSLSNSYDAVCFATVNPIVIQLAKKMGYVEIPFPKEFYEEGRKYLATRMKGGEDEFKQKAKCMMHFKGLEEECRKYIMGILLSQQE